MIGISLVIIGIHPVGPVMIAASMWVAVISSKAEAVVAALTVTQVNAMPVSTATMSDIRLMTVVTITALYVIRFAVVTLNRVMTAMAVMTVMSPISVVTSAAAPRFGG